MKARGFSGIATAVIALVLAAACLLPVGCGKKEWPSPRTEKDRFSWASVRASRDDSCLVIRGKLQGASRNLKEVVLQLETSQELCPGCPFRPDQRAVYPLRHPSLSRKGTQITITHCPVEPETALRLRLDGVNVFQQIPDAPSDIVGLKANKTNSTTF